MVPAATTIRGDTGTGTGTLTINGNVTISGSSSSGATLAVSLATDASGNITGNSQIAVGANTLNLVSTAGAFNIVLLNDAGLTPGQPYSMTIATGANAASFLRDGSAWDAVMNPYTSADFNVLSGSGAFAYSNSSVSVNNTALMLSFSPSAAPEPGSLFALSAAMLGVSAVMRRFLDAFR